MTVESKKHVIQEEVSVSEPDEGIDAYRQKATRTLRLHAADLLHGQDSFLRAIEQLSIPVQEAMIESAICAAAVLLSGRKPAERGTVTKWRKLISPELVDPVQLEHENRLREAGLRAQDAVELVPTIVQAGILLKDTFPFKQESLIAED